jgi:GST-like protein
MIPRPCVHFFLAKRDCPEMQQSRPFFRSEVLRLLGVLDSHLAVSKSGYISTHGYSLVDAGWVVYSDHFAQKGIGFDLDDFPHVKDWHERIYARPAVQHAYQKLGISPS